MSDWQETVRACCLTLVALFAMGGFQAWSAAHAANSGPADIRALDLSRLNGEIQVETDDDLRRLNDFSFDIIFRFEHPHEGHIFSLHEAWNGDGFFLKIRDDDRLELAFGKHGEISQVLSSEGLLETGRWYRLSGVKNGRIAKLFIDGKVAQSAEVADDIVDTKEIFQLGRKGHFSAAIQIVQFRFWREALGADQIVALASEDDRSSLPSPLIHYDFSTGGGRLIENKASQKYNGRIEALTDELGWVDIEVRRTAVENERGRVGRRSTSVGKADPSEERRVVLDAGRVNLQALAGSTDADGASSDLRYVGPLAFLALTPIVICLAWLLSRRLHLFGGGEARSRKKARDGADTERNLMSAVDVRRISGKLEQALDDDRLYRDPDLTLRQLSDAVGVTEHRISEVMNRHLDSSFYDFINGRRIAEAKTILQRDPERTVLDVAMDVGYNSKSTFYTAFKKVTGQSPAAFRRSVKALTDQEQVDTMGEPEETKRLVTP